MGAMVSGAVGGLLGLIGYLAGGPVGVVAVLAAAIYFGSIMPRIIDWELDRRR